MRRRVALGTATFLWFSIAACVGDGASISPNTPPGADVNGGNDASVSEGSVEDGDGNVDKGDACSTRCTSADNVMDCAGVERTCALGCSPELNACRTFDPAGPLVGGDLAENPAEGEVDLPATPETTIVDTATGAMTHPTKPTRAANVDPQARETLSGITFERRGGVAIFHARSWTLRNVIVSGDLPVAFVASGDVTIQGHVSTTCGQAGGAAGDVVKPGNGGAGAGIGTSSGTSGGGGGGHGTAGGKGADSIGDDDEQLGGGAAGPAFALDVANLRGGGSGGSGGSPGGRGGGVVVVVSGTSVRVGDGVTVTYKSPTAPAVAVPKGIHVGGCGGSGGSSGTKAGGGGGAGGLIVIEAPKVLIDANAGLAANGGGGGGTNTAGSDGKLENASTLGGNPADATACARGASGGKGAGGSSAAQAGTPNTPSCGEYTYGGGGGGGGGRIFVRNKVGNLDDRAPSSIVSPAAALDVRAL